MRSIHKSRIGFTLIELLVVIAIIALLAAITTPFVRSGIDRAREVNCANNLKQMGGTIAAYMSDHDGRLLSDVSRLAQYGFCIKKNGDEVTESDKQNQPICPGASLRPMGPFLGYVDVNLTSYYISWLATVWDNQTLGDYEADYDVDINITAKLTMYKEDPATILLAAGTTNWPAIGGGSWLPNASSQPDDRTWGTCDGSTEPDPNGVGYNHRNGTAVNILMADMTVKTGVTCAEGHEQGYHRSPF